MDDTQFQERRRILTNMRYSLCDIKSKDYATEEDRLINFKRISARLRGKISPEAVLLIYMSKHLDAIDSFVADGCKDDRSESIQGRIFDAQNYLDLLLAFVEEGKNEKEG